jgi:Tartrate dehydratase alpha subunit/Fumarate hydratase class I, N-terminal domain
MSSIPAKLIEDTARELTARAAIDIPPDYRDGVRLARDRETNRIARFVLDEMLINWDIATAERRPMCADTGLPRYYVKLGNEAAVEGGWCPRAGAPAGHRGGHRLHSSPPQSRAPADARRPQQQRGLSRARGRVFGGAGRGVDRRDHRAQGGLFGTDWRMLFPGDGVPGIKRFFVDTLIESGKRGLACQPAIVGVGIGGSKDTCMRLGKEAACLRAVGSGNPDPSAAPSKRS